MASLVSQNLQLTVFQVERSHYQRLDVSFERPHWAISHVLFGAVQTHKNGEIYAAPQGAVMVHPPGFPYREVGQIPGTHEWLVFDCALQTHLDLLRLYPVSPVVPLRDATRFSRVFEPLLRFWHDENAPFRELQISALCLQLLGVVLESWHESGAAPRPASLCGPGDRFAQLIEFMRANLDRKLSREALAKASRFHPNSLDRAFSRAHGQTPLQMLRQMRLERARTLLASTDLTLGAIAARVGFEDDAHFSHAFKARYSQTPGSFRQGVKKATQGYDSP